MIEDLGFRVQDLDECHMRVTRPAQDQVVCRFGLMV